MADINEVVISGNLTRDAEMKKVPTGTTVCKFTVACNEWNKDGEKANFFDCVLWDKQAEALNPYLKKGQFVIIQGTLKQNTWQTQNGDKRSSVSIRGRVVKLPPKIKEKEFEGF